MPGKDMTAELVSIATLLEHDPLTAQEVVEQLGTVTEDYGSNVLVAPNSPLFREANVVRQVDRTTFRPTAALDHIILTPAKPLPVAELTDAFGAYKEIPSLHDDPPERSFNLDMPGHPYAIALIARVQKGRAVEFTLGRSIRQTDQV